MKKSRRNTEMGTRRAKAKRTRLIQLLGGRCTKCGGTEELEFHHPNGRNWTPSKLNRWTRINRYWQDFVAGRLGLLCRSHNAHDANNHRAELR